MGLNLHIADTWTESDPHKFAGEKAELSQLLEGVAL
jgi:hypothetical protein